MAIVHWLSTAFQVYGMHPLRGDGYQWWSGEGSDLSEFVGPSLPLLALWKHHNCHHRLCPLPGHRHPDYGWPACKAHWHEVPAHLSA